MFVYGDVVYAQTWQVLTVKNCIEPFSYASTAYVVASALISVRLFWANGLPPPLAKNSPYAYDNNNTRNNSIIVYVGSSVTVHNPLFSFRAQGVSK